MKQTSIPLWPQNATSSQNWSGAIVLCLACVWWPSCFAQALGARVFPGHGPEIGFGFVELTAEGKRDALFGPNGPSVPVFQWHGDTFDLPEGSTLLAFSAEYPHQAFRFGSRVY